MRMRGAARRSCRSAAASPDKRARVARTATKAGRERRVVRTRSGGRMSSRSALPRVARRHQPMCSTRRGAQPGSERRIPRRCSRECVAAASRHSAVAGPGGPSHTRCEPCVVCGRRRECVAAATCYGVVHSARGSPQTRGEPRIVRGRSREIVAPTAHHLTRIARGDHAVGRARCPAQTRGYGRASCRWRRERPVTAGHGMVRVAGGRYCVLRLNARYMAATGKCLRVVASRHGRGAATAAHPRRTRLRQVGMDRSRRGGT